MNPAFLMGLWTAAGLSTTALFTLGGLTIYGGTTKQFLIGVGSGFTMILVALLLIGAITWWFGLKS